MDLILCHTTADFDTLGAAIGVARLRSGARIVLTGGMHLAIKEFLALYRDEYPLIERRAVVPEQVRSLTLVDAQQRSRIGQAAAWLDLPNVEITVYDHHTELDSDLPPHHAEIAAVGAITTLVVEQLQQQQLTLTVPEATAMALGIHADTGSLTFDHSTPRDARALAWLLEQGASLAAIAEYATPGLSPALQPLLASAINSLHTETVFGYTLAWVLLETADFTPGLSGLAGHLMEIVGLDALLLGAQYQRHADAVCLSLIGRSRIEGTDLNVLFQPLGGGGHARAVAANLHQADPQATLTRLVQQLQTQIPRPPIARELMSAPVRTIRPDVTIAEAQRVLLRYGHSGLSVATADQTLVGIISRRDIDIALHHGFSHAPVKGYMSTNPRTIAPHTPLPDIEALMMTYDIGRLPVLDNGQLVGIVTRTDILRQRHAEESRKRKQGSGKRQAESGQQGKNGEKLFRLPHSDSLLSILRDRLTPELWHLLSVTAAAAEQHGWQLYLVGGAVRDLLLAALKPDDDSRDRAAETINIEDIDLVVDGFQQVAAAGAGVELARSLQTRYPQARLEIHGKFQTAALLWHNDPTFNSLWIDIATARTEFYPYPAANPEVEASSIQQDLYRRDFTINALAVRLTAPHQGELLDFFGGVLDLQAQQIRVLHANSFIEDPTRIYRAVRFAVRLGFEIDAQTESYIHYAIASGIYSQSDRADPNFRAPALQTRLKAELKYLLQADYWQPALRRLADLGALQCIHPTLTVNSALWQQLRFVQRWLTAPTAHSVPSSLPAWLIRLEVILAQLAPHDRGTVAMNLQLPDDSRDRLSQLGTAQTEITEKLPRCDRPSQSATLLRQYDTLLLLLIAVRSDRTVRKIIWRYLTQWSQVKAPLNGNDLRQLGYQPSPQFKLMLEQLWAATLDGQVRDRSDATAFLQQHYPQSLL